MAMARGRNTSMGCPLWNGLHEENCMQVMMVFDVRKLMKEISCMHVGVNTQIFLWQEEETHLWGAHCGIACCLLGPQSLQSCFEK
jgi:hypothetical protein